MEIDLREFLRDRDQQVREKIRAEVAEDIAQAIDAEAGRDRNGVSAWTYGYRDGAEAAARIARSYTHTGQDPADRKDG